jgi:translation initiation factor IF-2
VNNAKAGLLNAGVILEELGGDIQCAEISAKQGQGIDELLEKILIQVIV